VRGWVVAVGRVPSRGVRVHVGGRYLLVCDRAGRRGKCLDGCDQRGRSGVWSRPGARWFRHFGCMGSVQLPS